MKVRHNQITKLNSTMPSNANAEVGTANNLPEMKEIKEQVLDSASIPSVDMHWNPRYVIEIGRGRQAKYVDIQSALNRTSGQEKIDLTILLLRAFLGGSQDMLSKLFGVREKESHDYPFELLQKNRFQLTVSVRPATDRAAELRVWLEFPTNDMVGKPISELEEGSEVRIIFQVTGDRGRIEDYVERISDIRDLDHFNIWGGVDIYTQPQ